MRLATQNVWGVRGDWPARLALFQKGFQHEPLETYVPENPWFVDGDWPYQGIDHILGRCGSEGRPTLPIQSCHRTFDQPGAIPSDHYGLVAGLQERQ